MLCELIYFFLIPKLKFIFNEDDDDEYVDDNNGDDDNNSIMISDCGVSLKVGGTIIKRSLSRKKGHLRIKSSKRKYTVFTHLIILIHCHIYIIRDYFNICFTPYMVKASVKGIV